MLRRLLYRLGARLPCRLITRDDGQPYLERYAMPAGLRRLLASLGLTVYLHRFVGGDVDRWVHDHPWRFAIAILLTGGYLEERVRSLAPGGWRAVTRSIQGWRRINVILARDFHRIAIARPDTWTLFVCTKRVKDWGFLEQDWHGDTPRLIYHQPFNTQATLGWEAAAPLGREFHRAPLQDTA